ncbi:hypothetical protein Hbl1158_07835 [Halobaculum sp. CBA1158]|uniref:DUF7551 domain-containing protein n=1 Tax=Halobaculum sp. CBA1158 TaxID=2904243 RepID=UPI001F429B58|nr:hypothetical protein [Halobaculum sp. CBA1158]UIO98475.1 hypothetical protein Hbl1158_07835 [Halobaculum sp. CBA1158]
MIGTALGDLRRHIESLADPDGDYRLVCARTGERPVPADGLGFPDRPTARAAVRSTEQYRATLRRYDPQVPVYDIVACEAVADPTPPPAEPTTADDPGVAPRPSGTTNVSTADARPPASSIDFCHTVAGVVFESIADSTHTELQDAIMDRYLDSAEAVDDPDELCVRLLGSIADELSARLDADAVAEVLRGAGERMPAPPRDETDPVAGVLSALGSIGMVGSYAVTSPAVDADADARTWRVTLEGYPLADRDRVVTLPVVVALFRRASVRSLSIETAGRPEAGTWRLALTANGVTEPTGLTGVTPRS